jgi:hypothetical protein
MAIDIGGGATNRASTISVAGYTAIDLANPANASGVITSVELWFNTNGSGVKIGTFYNTTGNNYRCRDVETIGDVTAGSKQTFEVSLDVESGDFIGIYGTGGNIEADRSGGSGNFYKAGDQTDGGEALYELDAGYVMSLYGTGGEAQITRKVMEWW